MVKVEEPNESTAIAMMSGLTATLEDHHGVRILNEAVVDSVKLSHRYISGRQLPDKSVSLLDTTCARIRLSQSSTPPALENCQRQIDQLQVSMEILRREMASGADHSVEMDSLQQQRDDALAQMNKLKERWQAEQELVLTIGQLQDRLEGKQNTESEGDATNAEWSDDDQDRFKKDLVTAKAKLRELQGDEPLVHPCVNSQAVAETVASWTGIPVGRMVADEIQTVLNLKPLMERSIIGQSHALERISQSIRTSRPI
ncbi:MAG: hypothetical protein R3C28_14065 [Pirellulaceae bacterium]